MVTIFGESADIFGDGSMIAYLTPTYLAGSVVYRMNDGDRFTLIVGDNRYSKNSWEKSQLPDSLYDFENMNKCLNWINEQSKDKNCIGVFCAHSLEESLGVCIEKV